MPSLIDWYHYTVYNLTVNPGDDYVFAEREVYRDRLSNLVPPHGPTEVCVASQLILCGIFMCTKKYPKNLYWETAIQYLPTIFNFSLTES
jgi:hypothetical protein